jgi:flagellar motor switch protein FliG
MDSTDNVAVMGAEKAAITFWNFGHSFASSLIQVFPPTEAIALPLEADKISI